MKNLKFGIEIETVDLTREALARAIQSVIGGSVVESLGSWHVEDTNRRIWKVVADASLSGGFRSGEIVSPILGYEDLDTLQQVVRAVRGAGAHVNQSTGIHYARAVVMRSRDARPASSRASLLSCCA